MFNKMFPSGWNLHSAAIEKTRVAFREEGGQELLTAWEEAVKAASKYIVNKAAKKGSNGNTAARLTLIAKEEADIRTADSLLRTAPRITAC